MSPSAPFIPESANFKDPFWKPKFLELANMLIELGANPKLVARYTDLSERQITQAFVSILGKEPEAGRITASAPRRYAVVSERGGYGLLLQATLFANCYLQLEAAISEPVNRGWLLATAYRSYLRLTPQLCDAESNKRLPISAAYDIVCHIGIGNYRNEAALRMKGCDDCGINYLTLREAESFNQCCPMCAVNNNFQRLADTSKSLKAKSRISAETA